MKKPTVTVMKASIFRLFFAWIYEPNSNQQTGRDGSCIVIAKNIEEAIAKAHIAFPEETIQSASQDTLSSFFRDDRNVKIVL